MRRIVWLALVGALGCKGGDEGGGAAGQQATEVLARSGEIAEEEDSLLERRDSLLMRREEIREKREELVERRREIREAGGDTSELDREVEELLDREKRLVEEEAALDDKYEQILEQRRQMMSELTSLEVEGDSAQVAMREQAIAAREKELARREDRLAQREKMLAEREGALARREEQMCGGATPSTIVQTVDAKGSKYTRKDVDPLLRRARSRMSRRGILASDLPAPARGLERKATEAMAEGDYGQARFAAAQLLSTVRSIDVDKRFIQAKIARLNAAIEGRDLDESTRAEVDRLFRDATASYGDGEFGRANAQLNRIYAKLD